MVSSDKFYFFCNNADVNKNNVYNNDVEKNKADKIQIDDKRIMICTFSKNIYLINLVGGVYGRFLNFQKLEKV